MKLRWHLLLFILIFGIEGSKAVFKFRNSAPPVGDAAEVHNIAFNLAHGRGYAYDWNDPAWRKLWEAQNVGKTAHTFDFIVSRHGAYPTMSRPPLVPLIVAGILRVLPHASFAGWRVFDSAAFAAGVCLLCDVAFVHGGFVGLIVMLVLIFGDPWRRIFIPGWWTEGLAFDFLALIVWLISNGNRISSSRFNLVAGLAVGLLCLDRSMFVLLMPGYCLLMAIGMSRSKNPWMKRTLIILAISAAVQMPWWIRNVAISGRFLPLGTQGGINLPDEYGDSALAGDGVWSGRGIHAAWADAQSGKPLVLPAGMTAADFANLWPYEAVNIRGGAFIVAVACTSLDSEIAVSDAGKRAAIDWIHTHLRQLPRLMGEKAWSLIRYREWRFLVAIAITAVGFFGSPDQKRIAAHMIAMVLMYFGAIMLTHVVHMRFMILMFPSIYLGLAIGISVCAGHLWKILRKIYLSISIRGSIKA